MSHKKTYSESAIRLKETEIDNIINECTKTKRDIVHNVSRISKQFVTQKTGWKNIEKIIKEKQSPIKNKFFNVSQEIHDKFRKICESQINIKAKRLSKLIVCDYKEHITDVDINNQEAFRFFAANKRGFGAPLKEISTELKRFNNKRSSCDIEISPEETILQDINAIRSKNLSPPKTIKKPKKVITDRKIKRMGLLDEDEKIKNPRNKIVFAEMKKLDPINHKSLQLKRKNKLLNSIAKLEEENNKHREELNKFKEEQVKIKEEKSKNYSTGHKQ
ncbi:hypothetical protein SteCoe_9946 [Stentor coeruleus]|uniref:Uncharacterized protein n=1 Tax=Stentor coeruleus TaxID=5963 RepID=A0A1R2CGH8_9CILI|nr:hypothetical protein SteCoe_9946 [Stentor coeruleus]